MVNINWIRDSAKIKNSNTLMLRYFLLQYLTLLTLSTDRFFSISDKILNCEHTEDISYIGTTDTPNDTTKTAI